MSKQTPGEIVRSQRKARRLTREQLAAACDVSTSTVARLELNNQLPKARSITRIAAFLNIPVEALLEAVAS